MIAGTPVDQYPEMAEYMHQTHYRFSKAPGSKAGQGHQQRPPSAGNGARPQAQAMNGPPGATCHHQAQRQQAQQQHPGQGIPRPQTAVPRAPASSAHTTSQAPFSQAGAGHAAPRVPPNRPVDSNGLSPEAERKTPSQARPPPLSGDKDWPALPKATPKQTSQGRGSTPAPRTSGFGGGSGSRSMASQADSQEQLAAQSTAHRGPCDFRTGQEVTELSRSPLGEYAYHPEPVGTREHPTPGPMTRVDPQHIVPTPQLPRAVEPRVPRANARQADGGYATDQLHSYRFRPDRPSHPHRAPQPQAEAAIPQPPHDPEVFPVAARPGYGAIQAPVDEAQRVPPSGVQQIASTNIIQPAKSSSDAAAQNAPTAHRPRPHSASAFHRTSPTNEASHTEESADREADFLDRARQAAAIKSEKLKDVEGQLKRLEADHEHLTKQRDLLEAKAIEDERRYLELRREADQHRHAAIVAVGTYQKARQEFSAKVSASGAQCQAKISELEKHLEAVRRDRDEALSTARVWIEQFKRDIGDASSTSDAEVEVAMDADGQQATAPGPDSRESNENETAKTQNHSIRRVLEESTERTRRALEVARELTRLKEVLERRVDEGRKTQDRLADEVAKKDQMIRDLTSTYTAMEAVAKQLQEKIEQQVKGSEAQIKEIKSECEKLRAERDQAISAYKTEHAAEQTKQQAAEDRLKELETELSKYSKLFEKYETDFDELDDEDESGSDAEALGRAIDRRLKELGAASDKKVDEMQKKLQEAEGRFQMVQKTLEEKRAQLKELKKELREHKSALDTAESEKSRQIDLLEERLKTVEHEKAEMEEKLTDATDELADLTVSLEAEKNKPKSDEAITRALRNNLEMAEAKIAFLESEHPAALGSGFHEYSELVDLRLKLRGTEEDLQAKQREIEVLQKRMALGSEKSAKTEAQALEIDRLKSEIADKIRIIQGLEERNLTQGGGTLELGDANGQTVLERWHSSDLTAVEAELVKITAKEIEGNWARKNAENKNRIKKLENSAKADEARIKKQEEEQKAMMARYETEIRSLKAQIDGQARLPLTENERDSSSSLPLSPLAGNETNDKARQLGLKNADHQDQDRDTVESVLEPTVDPFAVPDSLPVTVASFVGAQPSASPPTNKGKKRKVDALTGAGIGDRKSPLDADKSKEVLVDSTPLEAPFESSVNKRQIKKTRSNVEQEVEDGDWHPEGRVSTSARTKKKTTKATQSGVKRTGTRGQHQPSIQMPIATQNPAHLRRA